MRADYILKLLENGERIDRRKLDEFREIKVETGIIKKAEGSARVKIGNTDVIVGIKMNLGAPFPDVPDMGVLKTGAEFVPIASPDFDTGPPGEDATELARIVDRGIRESECIDLEKLCIKEGERVWEVYVDIHIINHDGNLIDASALASVAALKTSKMPELKEDKIVRDKLVKKLPVNHVPVAVTVGEISNNFIIDPIKEEEDVLNSRLSIAVTEEGKICAMQKGGNCALSMEEVEKMIDLAVKKSKEIRKFL
ncbi:MAG: RNA-binding protein [Theionarchaea archaeon DG-70]|nr:MAG: RNA-binding protein [Theionarchaea archaeon DG-70]